MSAYLTRIVDLLRSSGFLFDPDPKCSQTLINRFGETGECLGSFYERCDGGFFLEGDYFPAPNGLRYDAAIPRCSEAKLISEVMSVDDFFAGTGFASKTIAFLDRGDGDWVGACERDGHLLFIDFFHEYAGVHGTGSIVAESIEDFLGKFVASEGAFWLDDDFLPCGSLF